MISRGHRATINRVGYSALCPVLMRGVEICSSLALLQVARGCRFESGLFAKNSNDGSEVK